MYCWILKFHCSQCLHLQSVTSLACLIQMRLSPDVVMLLISSGPELVVITQWLFVLSKVTHGAALVPADGKAAHLVQISHLTATTRASTAQSPPFFSEVVLWAVLWADWDSVPSPSRAHGFYQWTFIFRSPQPPSSILSTSSQISRPAPEPCKLPGWPAARSGSPPTPPPSSNEPHYRWGWVTWTVWEPSCRIFWCSFLSLCAGSCEHTNDLKGRMRAVLLRLYNRDVVWMGFISE